jgi:hypothetical protein
MLDHLQKWIFHFMQMNEYLDKYNEISLSMPSCQNLTPKSKPYEVVSRWNRKEMKKLSRYLLGVETLSLHGGSTAEHPIYNRSTECVWAFLEFHMYAQNQSHNDAMLSYKEDSLHHFHTLKDNFLLGRAGTKGKAKANALSTELVKKRNVNEDTNAKTWMRSWKRFEMNAW